MLDLIKDRTELRSPLELSIWNKYLSTLKPEDIIPIELNHSISDQYLGDFTGLLDKIGIDPMFQYAMAKINNYVNGGDYNGANRIQIIDHDVLYKLSMLVEVDLEALKKRKDSEV